MHRAARKSAVNIPHAFSTICPTDISLDHFLKTLVAHGDSVAMRIFIDRHVSHLGIGYHLQT